MKKENLLQGAGGVEMKDLNGPGLPVILKEDGERSTFLE